MREENARLLEAQGLSRKSFSMVDNEQPNLVNLNEDPALSEVLLYDLREADCSPLRSAACSHRPSSPGPRPLALLACILPVSASCTPPSAPSLIHARIGLAGRRYMIREGDMRVGSAEAADVQLGGVFVLPEHCILHCSADHKVAATVLPDAIFFMNGHEIPPGTRVRPRLSP